MRRSFAIGILCVAGMAWGVFYMKNAVRTLDSELALTRETYDATVKRIHVLKAEWSYLNRPERLARLARRHLELQPVSTAQIVAFNQVPLRTVVRGGGQ